MDKEQINSLAKQTVTVDCSRVQTQMSRFRVVAELNPVAGVVEDRVRVQSRTLVLGRAGDVPALAKDPTVSRDHARIRRVGDEYLLEDLGSRNGTFVDGVPIVSCVLRGGDTIQIGKTVFFLDLILEPLRGA